MLLWVVLNNDYQCVQEFFAETRKKTAHVMEPLVRFLELTGQIYSILAQGIMNLVSARSMTQVYQRSRKCTKHTWSLKQPSRTPSSATSIAEPQAFLSSFFSLLGSSTLIQRVETDKERKNKTITPSQKNREYNPAL